MSGIIHHPKQKAKTITEVFQNIIPNIKDAWNNKVEIVFRKKETQTEDYIRFDTSKQLPSMEEFDALNEVRYVVWYDGEVTNKGTSLHVILLE